MSYSRETKVGVGPAPNTLNETIPGPLATQAEPQAPPRTRPSINIGAPRTRMERIGFWLLVVAAIAVLFLLAGWLLPPLVGGIVNGVFMGTFVAFLTLLNLNRPSGWANSVMGRKVFPVLRSASDDEIWRLAGVNGALTFVFAFAYQVLATTFLGGFWAGLVVFLGIMVLGVFYNRARKVVIRP
ncbi:MAG TPA: hypothetical protein VFR15_05000 [Chloroflexia bacterium]|nr:hypothetical protein [Chloroflexia bacterium]